MKGRCLTCCFLGVADDMGPGQQRVALDQLAVHAGFLRALARGMLRDEHLAEDVVQQAFLRALARPPASLGIAWLARVVRNLALDTVLGAERRARRERAVARDERDPTHERAALELALQREVATGLSELDEPYRTVVHLRYFRGLSPARIAAELGVPPKTVETRLTRAHARLRQRLERAWREQDGRARACYLASLPGAGKILGGLFMTKPFVLVGVGGALLVGLVFTWRALDSRSERLGAPVAVAPVEQAPAVLAANALVTDVREAVQIPSESIASEPELVLASPSEPELEQTLHGLARSLDRSLEGRLDPGAILDAALLVAEHELGAPVLEPDFAGRLVIPVEGMPAGVEAALCVYKPNRRLEKVLTLEISFERTTPFAFEDVERDGPCVQLTTRTNEAEELLHFSILTEVGEARLASGAYRWPPQVTHGVHLYTPLDDPSRWTLRASGMREKEGSLQADGNLSYRSASWEVAPLLEGGPWPRMEDMRRLSRRMLAMLAAAKNDSAR